MSGYVALVSTGLSLSVEQIIEYYVAWWNIESGFKEIELNRVFAGFKRQCT